MTEIPSNSKRTPDESLRSPLARTGITRFLPVAAAFGILIIGSTEIRPVQAEELPPGVEQLLPRGKIAAVFSPQFVAAAEAQIADEAWILGAVVEGEARAYSLNLLNRHEVVNDKVGNTAFAAVW